MWTEETPLVTETLTEIFNVMMFLEGDAEDEKNLNTEVDAKVTVFRKNAIKNVFVHVARVFATADEKKA